MAPRPGDSWAVILTAFFLKSCGFWPADSEYGKKIMDFLMFYTISGVLCSIGVVAVDVYKSYSDDFDRFLYCSLIIFTAGFGFFKLIYFYVKRKQLLTVISHAKDYFWNVDYDDYGSAVMKKCMLRGTGIVSFAVFMCYLTMLLHYIEPLIENRGRNESDRELPFRFYSDLPISLSPWFEILFATQIIVSYPNCAAYFCFDNLLCQMNITAVGLFIILHKEMREICDDDQNVSSVSNEPNARIRLIRCVQKHQQLISCIENINDLYRSETLGVVILLSLVICLEMFQIMVSTDNNPMYTFHYCVYAGGSMTQLYFYTMTCDNLTEASVALSDAAYDARWFLMESGRSKNFLVKDLSMVIMRSQKACSLTVGGFSPVTLQTFTSICNTAFSFLTLMRQSLQKNV